MAEGGHAEEEPGAETVAASGAVDSEGVLRQEVTVGTDVGDNDITTKREGGVSGDRACGGGLEDICNIGNCRLKRSMELHYSLHGFSAGKGMGMGTLEVKLAKQLAGIVHKPLFQVFFDIGKAYGSLDREWCM